MLTARQRGAKAAIVKAKRGSYLAHANSNFDIFITSLQATVNDSTTLNRFGKSSYNENLMLKRCFSMVMNICPRNEDLSMV